MRLGPNESVAFATTSRAGKMCYRFRRRALTVVAEHVEHDVVRLTAAVVNPDLTLI